MMVMINNKFGITVILEQLSKRRFVIFHKGSDYDYHVFIKKSMEEFKVQFECLGENAENYTTFSISIQKELANGKTVTYKSKWIYVLWKSVP